MLLDRELSVCAVKRVRRLVAGKADPFNIPTERPPGGTRAAFFYFSGELTMNQALNEFARPFQNNCEPGGLGAFALCAREAHAAGVAVIPTASADAKMPLVRNWARWSKPARLTTIEKWSVKYSEANAAILPGASGLVVVDADDRAAVPRLVDLFGTTPVVVESGQRGVHLYYQGVTRGVDLRRVGIEGEIKSARSIVVAPGSIHPKTGRPYTFQRGGWSEIFRAPMFPSKELEKLVSHPIEHEPEPRNPRARNPEGRRNASLYDELRKLAHAGIATTEDGLIAMGFEYNRTRQEGPEEDYKVEATARSVFRALQEGSLCAPRVSADLVGPEAFAKLRSLHEGYSDALALYIELRRLHGARTARGDTFAIAATAMAGRPVIPGWTDRKRYMRVRDALLSIGLIELVSGSRLDRWQDDQGNRRCAGRDAAQYCFGGV
jgi:hypothetical protein